MKKIIFLILVGFIGLLLFFNYNYIISVYNLYNMKQNLQNNFQNIENKLQNLENINNKIKELEKKLKNENPLKCGQAEIEENFEIKSDFNKLSRFIEENKNKITERMNIEILDQFDGNKLKLKRKNNRGTFIWIAKESIKKNLDSMIYNCEMIESIEGGMEMMTSEIKILKHGDKKCKINAKISVVVDDISSKDLRMDMKFKCNRIKNMLINELEN